MSTDSGMDRRQFLTLGLGTALTFMLAAEELRAEPAGPTPAAGGAAAKPAAKLPPVSCAVIGLGAQGRALLDALVRDGSAPVPAICDTYTGAHARALQAAPKAQAVEDYRRVLDRPDVDAVFIATPSHLHKQIALDAVAAGKHVYCEAPLAHTVEDAKAIALAGKGSSKVFQVGLVQRADPLARHTIQFIASGAMGDVAEVRAQWHKRTSWKRTAPNADREQALNWRLSHASSPGLVGEIGVHAVDLASWYLKALPVSVTGFGGILAWPDGRDVPDTVQCLFEYPKGIHLSYDATLANSFERAYQLFMGTGSAIFMRDGLGWMIKEADSQALGWEVYARKEKVADETGIALVADASKQLAAGVEPGDTKQQAVSEQTTTFNAVSSFLNAIRGKKAPVAGPLEGYQATVAALKANEAVNTGTKITFQKEWFDL